MDLGTESFVSGWLRVDLLRENVRNAVALLQLGAIWFKDSK